ncbi:MAG: peptidoglycan recognition protein family protein [Ginsengibacter sp.]
MQEKDFIECSFANDNTKYIGDITHVDANSFDCRFLNSGELYTFDSETMKVTSLGGAIPIGTQLASYTVFAADTTQNFQNGGYVVVTFADASRQLGQLTDMDASGNKSVTFLDSGSKYVFGSDNAIISTDDVKQVAAVTAIESYSAGTPVIVVSGADAGSGNTLNTSANINRFIPQASDTIVVNMHEFQSDIANFKNWSTNAALHNTNAKTVREPSAIRFILLHETSGGDGGSGFDPPYTSHFVVATDEIRQFNDLCEIEWHATIFNDAGIGIEFKNPDWVAKTEKTTTNEYIDANWSGDYPSYTVPSTDKLENLVLLIQRLISKNESGFPSLEPTWLQLVSYNDVSSLWNFKDSDIPADEKKRLKKFFIYSCGTDYMRPDNFDADVKGILSHNCVSNLITVNGKTVIDEDAHTDGSFQALYSWLRIMQSNEMNDAFTNAKNLVTNNKVTATTSQSYEGYNKPKGSAVYVPYSALSVRNVFLIDIETML